LAKFDMTAYAKRGAELRITEVNAELEAIYGAFPDLRRGSPRRGGRPARTVVVNHEEGITASGAASAAKLINIEETGRSAAPARRRRRKMTAAERRAVGERMRKYWAARKNAKK
jgi:hypothetical protein